MKKSTFVQARPITIIDLVFQAIVSWIAIFLTILGVYALGFNLYLFFIAAVIFNAASLGYASIRPIDNMLSTPKNFSPVLLGILLLWGVINIFVGSLWPALIVLGWLINGSIALAALFSIGTLIITLRRRRTNQESGS